MGVQKEPSPIHVNVGDDVVGRCVGGSVGTCVGGDCDVLCCVVGSTEVVVIVIVVRIL